MKKIIKEAVHYSLGMPKAHCGICVHFIKPDKCEIVQGTIKSGMWCNRFKKNDKRKTV
jgi:hypothetical protein